MPPASTPCSSRREREPANSLTPVICQGDAGNRPPLSRDTKKAAPGMGGGFEKRGGVRYSSASMPSPIILRSSGILPVVK